MKHCKTIQKNFFTLIELIVAMGVFSLMMLMVMTFFTSAQNSWTTAEQRNECYANARVALNVIERLLQTSLPHETATPFTINTTKLEFHAIYPFVYPHSQAKITVEYIPVTTSSGGNISLTHETTNAGNILEHAISCDFQLLRDDFTAWVPSPSTNGQRPSFVLVRLQTLGSKDFLRYQKATVAVEQRAIAEKHAYRFTRVIPVGK